MMAIARTKVAEEAAPPATEPKPDAEVTDTKKYSGAFLNPEDDSKRETREKFQIKFTGALKQASSKVVSRSPDVEIVKVSLGNQKVSQGNQRDASEDTKKTSAAASTSSAPSNVIVSKMMGLAKTQMGRGELSRPPGWVLKADAHAKPAATPPSFTKNAAAVNATFPGKNPLQNDKQKGPTLDIFSPESPKTRLSKFSPLPTSGRPMRFQPASTANTGEILSHLYWSKR